VAENWGDKLNPTLVALLSEREVLHQDDVPTILDAPVHLVIGSGLMTLDARHVVWGMGFMNGKKPPTGLPRSIHAVRGPLSRQKLIAHGIDCPEVFGDPALLCPLFFPQRGSKDYDVGVILHHREVGIESVPKFPSHIRVKVISVKGTIDGFLADIYSCHQILSSSLHGLIAAHAYDVPASWLKLSNLPLGDDFKFRDYFSSIGLEEVEPFVRLDFEDALAHEPIASPVKVDLIKLLEACPFISSDRRPELISRLQRAMPNGFRPKSAHRSSN